MNIRSLSPMTLSVIPRVSQQLSARSRLLAARPALPDLHRKYHGAPIGQHQTTEFLKRLVDAKESKELSFGEIAKKIGRSEVWTAALFYGQAKPEQTDLNKLGEVLDIPEQDFKKGFPKSFFPIRGAGLQIPPTDPLMYRLYEFLIVYGFPL
ncbi:Cyanate hydratase [Puccinia graminis f. sp. tritici]|uniref:Cyanate hydratase n=1 Tax=Puccinia graminis f. sp. tritici TaxID=56615 RepID=A0A5B0P5Z2_PUCGR|nr:Cyanate hydratase [Puccinia graminis f. sp. tritici]KAA1099097.1 Cyanate hydratase [Puccinia graminis f. sp. tritici]KAA1112742.1 Cyanate hydratase [Puccinia graminis f. sp. tritici]